MTKTRIGLPGGGGTATVEWGPDYGIEDDLETRAEAVLREFLLAGGLAAAAAVAMPNVSARGVLMAPAISSMPSVIGKASSTMQGDITRGLYTTTAILAQKDSWVDVVAGCVSDDNHNGTDLELDSVVATRKDIIVGWDVAGFPIGATVTSATFTIGLKTAPTASDLFTPNLITAASEGWTESNVRCSNIPATDGAAATAQDIGTGAGPRNFTFALNSTALTRLGNRMGVGSFSLRCIGGTLLTSCVFQSADEGTDNALGPRLDFAFEVSV